MKYKKILTWWNIIVFFLFLEVLFAINLKAKPLDVSVSERRKLKEFPPFLIEGMSGNMKLNESFRKDFENYVQDHFIYRDEFRKLKSFVLYDVFHQIDNHGIIVEQSHAAKLDVLNEISVENAAKKIRSIAEKFPQDFNIYYAIIPDKAYYLSDNMNYPSIDYNRVEEIMEDELEFVTTFSLINSLNKDSYYKTDLHWKQEELNGVLDVLFDHWALDSPDISKYKWITHHPFYGVYYGQSALPLPGDQLTYLYSPQMEDIIVSSLNPKTMKMEEAKIYNPDQLFTMDPYNLFLNGPQPLIQLINPNADINRNLYIFRDSFTSSLAPLLTEAFHTITLIDLRYLASPLVKELVEFEKGSDVLFLYSMQVLNNSEVLLIK